MTRKKILLTIILTTMAALLAGTPTAEAATKQELQAKFEKRYPQLLAYKRDGKVGENMQGLVEAIKREYLDDKTLAKLVDDENADRKELYKLLAAEEKTSVDQVAAAAAKRNYDKAKPGEYLKQTDGTWKKV